MNLRYDEDLVESAVFIAAGGRRRTVPALQIRRFHGERERCYDVLDPDQRSAAFFQVHLRWFREWGLENLLLDLLKDFPLLRPALNLLALRKVKSRKDEGAELYVHPETGRSAVVALRPERFADDAAVTEFLRHEYMHLHDMVDPAFGYSPDLHSRGVTPAQQRIVRERYRLLWDITIDGRLGRVAQADRHRGLLDRAYSFWTEERRGEVFADLWTGRSPTHARLLSFASDPRDLGQAHQPLPGASCPLCGFPTFDWAPPEQVSPSARADMEREFPGWTPAQGVCQRCLEVYLVGRNHADALPN